MSTKSADAATPRARSTYFRVIFADVIRSRLPCPATRCRPASAVTGSPGSSQGARPTTPDDARVVGGVHGGPGAHRVAQQHDRQAGVLALDLLERPAGVGHGRGLVGDAEVPASDPEAQQPQRQPGLVDAGLDRVTHP